MGRRDDDLPGLLCSIAFIGICAMAVGALLVALLSLAMR